MQRDFGTAVPKQSELMTEAREIAKVIGAIIVNTKSRRDG